MLRSRLLLVWILPLGCAPAQTQGDPADGRFRLLSYNVAGLPDGLNEDQNPEVNIPLISPKLNAYDLVLVQEDFAYTFELRADLELPYQSYPKDDVQRFMNDGLNRFSRFSFAPEVERVMWNECNGVTDSGSDCLAEKGFSFGRVEVAAGVAIDVYNLHHDAGGSAEDHAARAAQLEQLLAFVAARSADRPVIVAGDTNMKPRDGAGDDTGLLARLGGALTDACVALDCGDEARIDRVLLHSGDGVVLEALTWGLAEEMVDDAGEPLSDHQGVVVEVGWSLE